MKLNQIILAAALSLGVVSLANATSTNTIYVTGSTAMRGNFYSAIRNAGTVFTATPITTLFQGGGSSANFMAFQGTQVTNGLPLLVQCHWSGSEGGILDVASNGVQSETFIDPSLIDGTDHGSASPSTTTSAYVDIAMADNDQIYSRTTKPALASTNKAEVGIITFTWVRNPGIWTGTNLTDQEIRSAFNGSGTLALFTGNAADTGSYVYVSGRDYSSGTRVNAFGDTGFGILSGPKQIMMDYLGNMTTNLVYGSTTDYEYAGDFGFSSGGTLAGTMGDNTTTSTDYVTPGEGPGFSVIAYLSRGDANTAISSNAVECAYNGVSFSTNNIIEGKWPFFGNEYIMVANNSAGNSVAQIMFRSLKNVNTGINYFLDDSSGKTIKLTSMHCKRNNGPVSDPTHN